MKLIKIRSLILAVAVLGVTFQVGHFIEHLVQFGVWLGGAHDAPYMSPIAMSLSLGLGNLLCGPGSTLCGPGLDTSRQMLMGMEVLHLIGNGIFLVTIASLYYFVRDRLIRWAFYVEAFHLYEHIMLTLTALFMGNPVGLSTFFGGAYALGGPEVAVGYRVTWHFAMNLVPSALIMLVWMRHRRQRSAPIATPALA